MRMVALLAAPAGAVAYLVLLIFRLKYWRKPIFDYVCTALAVVVVALYFLVASSGRSSINYVVAAIWCVTAVASAYQWRICTRRRALAERMNAATPRVVRGWSS